MVVGALWGASGIECEHGFKTKTERNGEKAGNARCVCVRVDVLPSRRHAEERMRTQRLEVPPLP